MPDEELVNSRLAAIIRLLDSVPLASDQEGERTLNEVTSLLSDPELLEAAARIRRSRH